MSELDDMPGMIALTVTRAVAIQRNAAGDVLVGSTSTFAIRGSVQPANGREMANLPEGTRSSDTRKMYTGTELRPADQHAGTPADRVLYQGHDYQVRLVGFQSDLLAHYKVLMVREQE